MRCRYEALSAVGLNLKVQLDKSQMYQQQRPVRYQYNMIWHHDDDLKTTENCMGVYNYRRGEGVATPTL